jgi:biopolymer transport protein ExbD
MADEEKSSVVGEINVTPMVDVMLVLLIIFMVVTPAIVAGFQARLPQGIHLSSRPEDENRVTLGIDRNGQYYLDRKPIDRAAAPALLAAEFARRPEDKVLYLKADRRLPYSQVMAAMVMARAAGARVVAAVSEKTASAGNGQALPLPVH